MQAVGNIKTNKVKGSDLIKYCSRMLADESSSDTVSVIEYLLCEILNCRRFRLYTEEFIMDDERSRKLENWLSRLKSKEPVQYITSQAYFMDFGFYVDERNLIPRPETELLVKEVINVYDSHEAIIKGADLGTGCGNIAISIARYLAKSYMIAVDISKESLEVASINANKYNILDRLDLRCGDMFDAIGDMKEKLDFIVSNPPYMSKYEIENELTPEVSCEPEIALYGGKDGMDFYREIIDNSSIYLKQDGYVFFEVADKQAEPICEYAGKNSNLELTRIICDYNNISRIVVFKK